MNIFVLDEDYKLASLYHCDKHIVKMPLETAQMLCTSHWLTGGNAPYKASHIKHPCNLWILESIENYDWLCLLGLNLCFEYTYRYKKIHKCQEIIEWCISNKPNLPKISKTDFPLAMPEKYKSENPIKSYRDYYIFEKSHLHKWLNREKPDWIK